ncbi:enoyl-CoA hydratase/isomerase family protein [Sphingomonas sp.]|uniref:enoyl-CoA hydratase/isomerase family protein n=1 Tax=Sphingomonas sp. TaxID=28214 RepID=UPI003AFF7803
MAKPDMIAAEDLAAVSTCDLIADRFGPATSEPLIAFPFDDDVSVANLSAALANAPCPIIGIGRDDHPLARFCDVVLDDTHELARLRVNVARAPLAAMVLVQQLRLGERLDVRDALVAESLAFAAVQRGPEFLAWLRDRPPIALPVPSQAAVQVDCAPDLLSIALVRPETRNAIDAQMRDALIEMLDVALVDEHARPVRLTGSGRCFSTGGALWEFGTASDAATAHWIRTVRSPASRLARLAPRLTARVQGAAIGAGLEMAAFASHVVATADAWFQLPELRYGLIPGAGGTVSLPRRIGRRRTAYMALSMRRVPASLALGWGLVDSIER